MEDTIPPIDTKPDPKMEETQKLVHRITRLAGVAFLAFGAIILLMGGDIILGSVLVIIGITDIVLVPHIIESVIMEKLKQRNNQRNNKAE